MRGRGRWGHEIRGGHYSMMPTSHSNFLGVGRERDDEWGGQAGTEGWRREGGVPVEGGGGGGGDEEEGGELPRDPWKLAALAGEEIKLS